MRQLFDGKRYDGLRFEPSELREAVWMLSEGLKKPVLIPGSAWHRLNAALRRMPKFSHTLQPLHTVRNDIVYGRLSVAELYRSEKRRDDIVETTDSAAVLAALDEALLTAGLRVVKNDIGEFDFK